MERNISPLVSLRHTLMADRGALPLLRPLFQRPSSFPSFSNIYLWRFQNPKSSQSPSHLRYFYSVKVIPPMDKGGGYGRKERRKKGRKQRELWEKLLEDNFEEEDDDDGDGNSGSFDLWKILEEIVENVWILKAFKSYGYLLPFILLSLFFSTGPKAFLVSLAVAIGPSLLFYAFQKLIGWDKRRVTSMANQFGIEEEEEVKRSSRTPYKSSSVRKNDNGRSVNLGSAETTSTFGGWDDGIRIEQLRNETKRKPMKKRKKIRREAAEPLLLRLLVSLFPFLSSYTNMLK